MNRSRYDEFGVICRLETQLYTSALIGINNNREYDISDSSSCSAIHRLYSPSRNPKNIGGNTKSDKITQADTRRAGQDCDSAETIVGAAEKVTEH